MSIAGRAAPEIIAILTTARPDLVREMMNSLGLTRSVLSDPWEAAVVNACLLSGAVDESPAGLAAAAFSRFLSIRTKRERFAKAAIDAFFRIQISKGVDAVAAAFLEGRGLEDIRESFLKHGLEERAATKAVALLSQFIPEYSAARRSWHFGFSVGPDDLEALRTVAAACGGTPASAIQSNDVAIIDLPFSAFVGTTNEIDPTVLQVIEDCGAVLKDARHVLFRVDWTVGSRLPSSLKNYREFLSKQLPNFEFRSFVSENSTFDPLLDGTEAFIAGSPTWTGRFRPVEVIASDLNNGSSLHNAPALESALRGLLRAI